MKPKKAKIAIRLTGILFILLLLAWINKPMIFKWLGTKYFANLESEHLSQAYRGIETSKGREFDLFPIKSTGVSTVSIKQSADNFLASLNDSQLDRVRFDINDEEWRRWSNVDNGIYKRQGISLKEMSNSQQEAAFQLLQNSLSIKGMELSRGIMKTDHTLSEIMDGNTDFSEELYFLTIMGEPSIEEPWGWQLDGHHLVINYFILGDQVVMTPTFMGAEPVITTTGKYKGNTLFQDEQNLGLAFIKSLSEKHQKLATISTEKQGNNNLSEAFKDNHTIDYEGLPIVQLDSSQKEQLLNLVGLYINNMREEYAQIKMEEVEERIDETWFAWVGEKSESGVFYYRIHSPVVLIEFDHQNPVGVPSDIDQPTKNHIHTVVRTPNGNDYGKDLLRQHLERDHAH